jgi:PepSY-associated TM region
MLKKNLYQWHRRLSLLIAIPLVLSAGSGFMHPLMTNIRPAVATQGLSPVPIDSSKLRTPLQTALQAIHIDSISRFRIIHIDTNWFYQVQVTEAEIPLYLSTLTGKILPRGDYLYARWLARQFLEGPPPPGARAARANPAPSITMDMSMPMPDCCASATASVLEAKGRPVREQVRLGNFDDEYNAINRLLPVYKVAFDRPDGIRIYVETAQDRFAFAVDNKRAAFNKVFQYIHTYQWLNFLGKGKQIVEFALIALAFLTTLLGICIFFSTRSKKVAGNNYTRARRNHRYTAIVVSLFTLMFTFSGAFHALYRLKEDTRDRYFVHDRFATTALRLDFPALIALTHRPIADIGIVSMDTHHYWRLTLLSAAAKSAKDLMKDQHAAQPNVLYVAAAIPAPPPAIPAPPPSAAAGLPQAMTAILPDGEARYAGWLATQFSGHPATDIVGETSITRFDNEYNFTDKRLPVWKVSYASNGHERYFVETSTGRLSVRVDDSDLVEAYSFALLHKHEFLGWAGKSVKDASTMFWAAAQLVMVFLGLTLYFAWRRRQH